MRQPHVIRLHGPWEFEIVSGTSRADARSECAAGRMRWPGDAGMLAQPENRGGDLWLRRRFARPTGLEPHTAVTLCIAGAVAGGVVRLNDNELGRLPARGNLVRFDVTRMLLPRNQLVLKCPLPAPSDSVEQAGQPLMGQVGLEIESA